MSERTRLNILDLVKDLRLHGYTPSKRDSYLKNFQTKGESLHLARARDSKVLAQGLDASVMESYFANVPTNIQKRRQENPDFGPADEDWTFYTTGRDAARAAHSLI